MNSSELAPWNRYQRKFAAAAAREAGRLVARVATSGGARRPVGWAVDEFFASMAEELDAQGVSVRVAASMLGTSRRTYQRQVQGAHNGRHAEASSLWWDVVRSLANQPAKREELLARFARHPAELVASILFDQIDSGIVFESEGRLRTRQHGRVWDDAQIMDLIAALTVEDELRIEDVALVSGATTEHVTQLANQAGLRFVEPHERDAIWPVLRVGLEHMFEAVRREIAGESTDTQITYLQIFEARADVIDEYRAAFEASRAQVRAITERGFGHGEERGSYRIFSGIIADLILDR